MFAHFFAKTDRFYRPLPMLVYHIEQSVAGNSPVVRHLTNITCHWINALPVAWLARLLLQRSLNNPPWYPAPIAAGLFFLVHSTRAEGVSWISSRFDILATMFALASLISLCFYIRGFTSSAPALSFFLLSLLCKESTIILPLLIPVLFLGEPGRSARGRVIKSFVFFSLLLSVFIACRAHVLGDIVGG